MLLCLFVSAFFAASETALTGASRASMLRLSKQGNSDATRRLQPDQRCASGMIGALLLGNNIANIGASALATGVFTAWFGDVGVLYATAVMTVHGRGVRAKCCPRPSPSTRRTGCRCWSRGRCG